MCNVVIVMLAVWPSICFDHHLWPAKAKTLSLLPQGHTAYYYYTAYIMCLHFTFMNEERSFILLIELFNDLLITTIKFTYLIIEYN